jgi:hypothetical protein
MKNNGLSILFTLNIYLISEFIIVWETIIYYIKVNNNKIMIKIIQGSKQIGHTSLGQNSKLLLYS